MVPPDAMVKAAVVARLGMVAARRIPRGRSYLRAQGAGSTHVVQEPRHPRSGSGPRGPLGTRGAVHPACERPSWVCPWASSCGS